MIVPILGWALAVILHVAWNGGLVLTSVMMDEEAGLLKLVAVQTAIVIVPAVLVLYAIARMSARHELQILREELRTEVERGTITEGEYAAIVDTEETPARACVGAGARRPGSPPATAGVLLLRPIWPCATTTVVRASRPAPVMPRSTTATGALAHPSARAGPEPVLGDD